MKKISYSILCLILFSQVNAILLINENFDYVLGDDLAKYGWSVYSGSGTGEILISSPGLSYSNYANSDIGYSAKIDGPGEDLSHSFDSSISSGSVYYSFMASFSGASYSSDNYIICFRVSGETYRARFFIKKESEESNNVRFGICKSSSIPSVTTSYDYSLNQVYLFVIKYTFQTGDDEVCLFINPNLSGEEPDPIISSTEGTDATYLAEACIRQESGVYGLIDGIRVAQSWGDSPLPVTLSSFTGICENGYPQLDWVTQSELENMGWYIFRSEAENGIEANDFLLLNETLIPGNGTTTQPSSYEFTDDFAITTGETYWYWLQSVSYSNELEMYGPVSVLVEEGDIPDVPVSSSLYQNYPNPFNPTTTITFDIKEGDTGKLTIYNVLGQKVMEQEYPEGSQTLTWEAKDQASGIYFYNLKTGSYAATRKMLLLR